MAGSVQTWHRHLDGSFIEDIEEGLLDNTNGTFVKFQEKSSSFPKTAEHGWKEFVSDPSHSEIESSKAQENPGGHKDWEHYLSVFSLNDDDPTKFVALEVHTDNTQDDMYLSNGSDFKEKEHFHKRNGTVAKMTEEISLVAKKKSIESQEDVNEEMMERGNSLKNSFSHSLEDTAYPVLSKQNSAPPRFACSAKEYSPDGQSIVRPDSAPTIGNDQIYSEPGLMSGTGLLPTSDMVYGLQKTLRMPVRGGWQPGIQFDKRSPFPARETEPTMQLNALAAKETLQTSVEERNISPVDVHNIANVDDSPITLRNPGLREQRNVSGVDEITNSVVTKIPPKTVGKESNVLEKYTHLFGDGMKSDDEVKGTNNGDSNLELKDDDGHSVVDGVWDEDDNKTDFALLAESKLNTNSADTKHVSRSHQTENTTNVSTSREVAENLPIRPLTIGNSLTIGSTFAHRPISPFQPDLYATSTTTSVPMVPSTSSVATTSPSQYSERMLDEESGDISARERLQPLGRDGLEVKQGPPWGVTMPLFQPDSRNSSLSSNDSNTSSTQFLQVHTNSNQTPCHLETEPLQIMSSTPSEADLSRKASVKSLEPKEPIGIKMMKTPLVGKFHQQNLVDVDSPVSKILGPTFKTTQKMLEELQRRPLGAYDEDLEQLPIKTENTRNAYERESSIERRAPIERGPVSHNRLDRSHGSPEKAESSRTSRDNKRFHDSISSEQNNHSITRDLHHEVSVNQQPNDLTLTETTNFVDKNIEDLQKDCGIRSSRVEAATKDAVNEFSTNQRTLAKTTAHLEGLNYNSTVTDGLQGSLGSGHFSSEKETETLTKTVTQHSLKNQPRLDSTPKTMANIGLVSSTHSPAASVEDNIPEKVVSNLFGSSPMRNGSPKTQQKSRLTDSTLGLSVGLLDDLGPTQVETKGAELSSAEPESPKLDNVLENCFNASDLSEFERVASASISWSNAVAKQFREEMKSAKYKVEEGFPIYKYDGNSVNKQGATTSILDSGLSESSTNDEIYRPKQLPRLSADNEPVGIYDVRQSSGPGSSNRKRLALGKKPRETSKSFRLGDIYVSDGTMGTSSTDRDSRRKSRQSRSNVHRGIYVSEGTTSGTEPVDNGIDSGPEGQSTPKSVDISARRSNTHTTNEDSKPMNDIYLSPTKAEKPKSRSGFTSYEIEKSTRLSPSAFTNYKPFTLEIDKRQSKNLSGTSENDAVIRGNDNHEAKILASPQQGSNVTQPGAQVEHTWSISKPVMSQLSTGEAVMMHDVYPKPRSTTKQQSLKQTMSYDAMHRRSLRHKETIPMTIQEKVKDQTSSSMKSDKKHNGPIEKKKSVADIILENMIQDEQKQKKRHKKLDVKQKQATQDLNQLWERFQDVFGKKSKSSLRSETSQRSQPFRETTPTDVLMASSSDSESKNIGRQSVDISTDSDEEFERFLRRIREIQSSESSYQEDNISGSSMLSSSHQRVTHGESRTTPGKHLRRKPLHKVVNRSTSMASTASSDDGPIRRPQASPRRKAIRRNVGGPVLMSSSVTERQSETPVSLPMRFSVKNAEIMKQSETSPSCTCGAKSREETKKTISVRDIGINCPTPPIVAQEFIPVATDIAVLKTGPSEENISNSASLVKLSLQDAFWHSQQHFIERSRERVKKVLEKRDNRQNEKTTSAQIVVVMPSEKVKAKRENKRSDENVLLHMKSSKQYGQLQRKKPRPMSTKEIRDVNKRMYKNLPEVRKKRDEERRAEFYKANRLRAQLYGKHVRNTNRIFTAA